MAQGGNQGLYDDISLDFLWSCRLSWEMNMYDVSYIQQYACISSIVALYFIERGKWKYITFFGIVCLAQYICVYYLDTYCANCVYQYLVFSLCFPFFMHGKSECICTTFLKTLFLLHIPVLLCNISRVACWTHY
jgi:hypothetical protein